MRKILSVLGTISILLGTVSPAIAQPRGWNETIDIDDYGLPPSAIALKKIDCVVTVFHPNTNRPLYTYWIKGIAGFDGNRPVYGFLNDLHLAIANENQGRILPFSQIAPTTDRYADRVKSKFQFEPDQAFSLTTSQHGLYVALGRNANNQLIAQIYHQLSPTYGIRSASNLCYVWD
ncbi:hypothetical protein [Lusitaniella coriacea]|uniref:hypothetical protein n=1 Tax=Lusitaniella coriacea TaxID=1983105 RepID=UPI003CEEEF10